MTGTVTARPDEAAVRAALATVEDPEIHKPVTELGMVSRVVLGDDGTVAVTLLLTVAGCPLKDTLIRDTTAALAAVSGVRGVSVEFGVMTDEQRTALRRSLRGDADEPIIPFARPGSTTRVYCVASGKGGVGKSSVAVNLAASLAARGLAVGILDADIHGHSVPRMLGAADARPTQVERMIMPPRAYGIRLISVGMFTDGNAPVVWRGPMLHRALQQFLADVFWGDLDVLLLDLPPGTGDIAISLAQMLPTAEILVVTTPQQAAAEVAERAGTIAVQTGQRIAGVVENMSWFETPEGARIELFGSGGGAAVAQRLTLAVGTEVPLLGQIPLDQRLREGGDAGHPLVLGHPDAPAARALVAVADRLAVRPRGLAGRRLSITPNAGRPS
ncbi:Mrp/NBP35 family ATP-binding protein [Pseudonocardia sp. GCM10023141]|uniref:Mrp/NBP35 family ATP-binding protein n=1 Tax=Pseudonocardia sp. GCM10023141 TaxID=3252653 RepID=UPI003615F112